MPEANIGDRSSVERLYPRETFDRDAGENSDAKATVHRGVRIVSGADANGRFSAEQGLRHVGESDPEGDTIFLVPFLMQSSAPFQQTDTYSAPAETGDALAVSERKDQDYQAFIDRVVEAVKAAEFKPAVGRNDDRLRGFHGG